MSTSIRLCAWRRCEYAASDGLPVCFRHAMEIHDHVRTVSESLPPPKPLTPEQKARAITLMDDKRAAKRMLWGQIYYIRLNDVIKIGWTSCLNDRLISYHPGAILLAHHSGTRADERDLHRSFKPLRVHGREWYRGDAQIILDHIAKVIAENGEPKIEYEMSRPKGQVTGKRSPTVTAGKHHV